MAAQAVGCESSIESKEHKRGLCAAAASASDSRRHRRPGETRARVSPRSRVQSHSLIAISTGRKSTPLGARR